jgi:uncharacterized protein YjbJ (UPF0337 family)
MITDQIKGDWHILKGKILTTWAKLTSDDVTEAKGNLERLKGVLQKKYGYTKDKVDAEIEKFLEKHGYKKENLN